MAPNLSWKAALSPSILDPFFLAEDLSRPSQWPVPFALDSGSDNYTFDSRSISQHSTTMGPQSESTSALLQSGSSSALPVSIVEDDEDKKPLLALLPFRKAPRPPLPRPLNIAAYTKPKLYQSYIDLVLTPVAVDAARSSLTTIIDSKALSHLRKNNGRQFNDIVQHEIVHQMKAGTAAPSWIRDVLFPPSSLPPDFADKFYDSKTIWTGLPSEKWVSMPKNLTEDGVVTWLNWVASQLRALFGLIDPDTMEILPGHSDRSWDACAATAGPKGGTQNRKPDICLLSRVARANLLVEAQQQTKGKKPAEGPRLNWSLIQAFIEVTTSQTKNRSPDVVAQNIVEKAYLIFECQPYRQFLISLAFFGPPSDPKWMLVFVDRAGVVKTGTFNFHGSDGLTLSKVLGALILGTPSSIGIDESMAIDEKTGMVTHITVTGETLMDDKTQATQVFRVVRLLHTASQLSGRATRVWLVENNNSYFVLKDSWPLQSNPFSEIRHLRKINLTILGDPSASIKLKHTYPLYVIGQEFKEGTEGRRKELFQKPLPRVHRRIVTKPVGDALTSFRSKFEFCSVLCDVVVCESYLSIHELI